MSRNVITKQPASQRNSGLATLARNGKFGTHTACYVKRVLRGTLPESELQIAAKLHDACLPVFITKLDRIQLATNLNALCLGISCSFRNSRFFAEHALSCVPSLFTGKLRTPMGHVERCGVFFMKGFQDKQGSTAAIIGSIGITLKTRLIS